MNNVEHDTEQPKPLDALQPAEKPLILAVDDMSALLSSLVKMLQGQFNVMAVTSGKAALQVIEKHTPVIFLTAKNRRDDVIAAVRHGGNDYIVKPVDKELLLSKISRYMPQSTMVSKDEANAAPIF